MNPGRFARTRSPVDLIRRVSLLHTVRLTFHVSDQRHRDVDHMTSTLMDCLVRAGALPDDNRFEVGLIKAEAVDCGPGLERVEVEIEPGG